MVYASHLTVLCVRFLIVCCGGLTAPAERAGGSTGKASQGTGALRGFVEGGGGNEAKV